LLISLKGKWRPVRPVQPDGLHHLPWILVSGGFLNVSNVVSCCFRGSTDYCVLVWSRRAPPLSISVSSVLVKTLMSVLDYFSSAAVSTFVPVCRLLQVQNLQPMGFSMSVFFTLLGRGLRASHFHPYLLHYALALVDATVLLF